MTSTIKAFNSKALEMLLKDIREGNNNYFQKESERFLPFWVQKNYA